MDENSPNLEIIMNGCCYSCKLWKSAKIKQALFDVKRVISDEEIIVEFDGKQLRMRTWKYSITEFVKELINGIKDGSVRYCNGRLIKPWDFCVKFEPRIIKMEIDISSGEEYESAYLTCWTEEGCPFKERCYKEQHHSYFG